MIKNIKTVLIIGLAFFIFSSPVGAFTTKTGNVVNIVEGEVIDDSLFISGSDVYIDGVINGDLFCAGRRVEINGTVNGDVICAGQSLTVKGKVSGDIRTAGQNLIIGGTVGQNVTAFGQSIISDSFINGEMLFAGQDGNISGRIGKNILGFGQSVKLNAQVVGNAELTAENLNLGRQTVVDGNLTYFSNNQLSEVEGATVSGKTVRKPLPVEKGKAKQPWGEFVKPIRIGKQESWPVSLLKSIFINLIVGLILAFLLKDRLLKTVDTINKKVGRSIWIGLGLIFFTPAVVLMFVITILGIPLAVILAFVFGFSVFVSRIVAAMAIGRRINAQYWTTQKNSLMAATVSGVIASWIAFSVPVLGWFLSMIGVLWGMGGVYYFVRPEKKVK